MSIPAKKLKTLPPSEGLFALGKGPRRSGLASSKIPGELNKFPVPKSEEGESHEQVEIGSKRSAPSLPGIERKTKSQRGEDLVTAVKEGKSKGDFSTVVRMVEDTLTYLKTSITVVSTNVDIDRQHYLSLIYVAKVYPSLFQQKRFFDILCSLMSSKETQTMSKSRSNVVPVVVANIFLHTYVKTAQWPIEFVKLFLEDSLGDRVWVDDELCKTFVDNIMTAFTPIDESMIEDKRMIQQVIPTPIKQENPPPIKTESAMDLDSEFYEDEEIEESSGATVVINHPLVTQSIASTPTDQPSVNQAATADVSAPLVKNRYTDPALAESIKQYTIELINAQLNYFTQHHQHQSEAIKNVIRVMSVVCEFREIRLKASDLLEEWLNNATLIRWSKDLLSKVVSTCKENVKEDYQTLCNITKMKLKPMHTQLLVDAITQLVKNNRDYPIIALKNFIYNEILPGKSAVNFKILIIIYKSIHNNPEEELAFILQDLAMNESYKSLTRGLMKKILKILTFEVENGVNLVAVCRGLVKERLEIQQGLSDQNLRSSWISSIVDLIVSLQLLAVPSSAITDTNVTETEYRVVVAKIQSEAVNWFHTVVLRYAQPHLYTPMLKRVFFLENSVNALAAEVAGDAEKAVPLLRLVTQSIPVFEDTITRIVILSLTKFPLSSPDALDILEHIIRRVASVHFKGADKNPIFVQNNQLVDAILELSMYRPPNVTEDQLKEFPKFAVTSWWWQSCCLVLIIAAFNPSSVGKTIWDLIPTLRTLMQMIITRNWKYPPIVKKSQRLEEAILAQEAQLQRSEKEQILSLENILSQATRQEGTVPIKIDESNSILINQLITFYLSGMARQPPLHVIKKLQSYDNEFKIGHKLASSRNPDFVLEIMNEQGGEESMVWLGPIIENEPDTLGALPISCLAELLITCSNSNATFKQLPRLVNRLIHYLSDSSSSLPTTEILNLILGKLKHSKSSYRECSKRALSTLFIAYSQHKPNESTNIDPMIVDSQQTSQDEIDKCTWLDKLPNLLWFKECHSLVFAHLTSALLRETIPSSMNAYVNYLYKCYARSAEDTINLAMELSKFMLSRSLIVGLLLNDSQNDIYYLLLKLFTKIISTNIPQDLQDSYSTVIPVNSPMFCLPSTILHAIIQVLANKNIHTHGEELSSALYDQLVNKFFPAGNTSTKLVEGKVQSNSPSSQHKPLLSTPLAIKFIKTNNPVLIKAGLQELSSKQVTDALFTLGTHSSESINLVLSRIEKDSSISNSFVNQQIQSNNLEFMRKILHLIKFFQTVNGVTEGKSFMKILDSKLQGKVLLPPEIQPKRIVLFHEKPRVQPLELNPIQVNKQTILHILESALSSDLSMKSRTDLIALIQQLLHEIVASSSAQSTMFDLVVLSLTELIDKKNILGSMVASHNVLFGMSLIRSLFTLRSKLSTSSRNLFMHLISNIHKHVLKNFKDVKNNSFISLIYNYHHLIQQPNELQSMFIAHCMEFKWIEDWNDLEKSSKQSNMNALEELVITKHSQLAEQFMEHHFINQILHQPSNQQITPGKEVIDSSRQLAMRNQLINLFTALLKSTNESTNKTTSSGLLLDWIAVSDISLSDPSLTQYIFSKPDGISSKDSKQSTLKQDRKNSTIPFLLSSLLHQSSWNSLRTCANNLLQSDNHQTYSPSSVISFIHGYLLHPRSWTGYTSSEVAIVKTTDPPTIYTFNERSTRAVVDYIINYYKNVDQLGEIPIGFELLLFAVRQNVQNLYSALLYADTLAQDKQLINNQSTISGKPLHVHVVDQLYSHLYFAFPNAVNSINQSYRFMSYVQQDQITQLDLLLHTVFRKLIDSQTWSSAYIICRKLAVNHPQLVIRYLSTISSLLEGRVHIRVDEFIERQYHRIFLHVLGILDILRPQVLQSEHLSPILDSFIALMSNIRSQNKQLVSLLSKIIDFLCHYTLHNSQNVENLAKHTKVFSDLLAVFPDLKKIQLLIDIITKKIDTVNQLTDVSASLPLGATELNELHSNLKLIQRDDMTVPPIVLLIDTLNDIDKVSLRSPNILSEFISDFLLITKNPSIPSEVRNTAYKLLIRSLQHSARDSHIINEYLSSLQHTNEAIRSSAVEHAADFFHFAQDREEYFLQKLFLVHGQSGAPQLTRIVSELIESIPAKNV